MGSLNPPEVLELYRHWRRPPQGQPQALKKIRQRSKNAVVMCCKDPRYYANLTLRFSELYIEQQQGLVIFISEFGGPLRLFTRHGGGDQALFNTVRTVTEFLEFTEEERFDFFPLLHGPECKWAVKNDVFLPEMVDRLEEGTANFARYFPSANIIHGKNVDWGHYKYRAYEFDLPVARQMLIA